MADRDLPSDDPRLIAAARHALHDEELVAAHAVDGDAADDPARARALIERCTTCRDLHADLVAIGSTIKAAGTADLVGAARPAPRDFRLTASDAVRLRGGNPLQRWAARFKDGLATFGRPVGASLAALGVVGLLVGTVGLGQAGLAPMAGGPTSRGAGPASGGAGLESTFEISRTEAAQSPTTDTAYGPQATRREELSSKSTGTDSNAQGGATTSLMLGGSIVFIVLGLALLVAGTRRRRRLPARRQART